MVADLGEPRRHVLAVFEVNLKAQQKSFFSGSAVHNMVTFLMRPVCCMRAPA